MKRGAFVFLAMLLLLTGCGGAASGAEKSAGAEKTALTFAYVGWDSAELNNTLAGIVAQEVFGYTWEQIPGSTPIMHEALLSGEIDVNMEEWTDNMPTYAGDLADGKFVEVGVNYNDNFQGLYIPRYLADQYPDLKTVQDLADYAALFPDPEGATRGIIYGGIPGWEVTTIMEKKVAAYGLDDAYNYFVPGSQAAMDAALTSAWDRQAPIVAYYWEPTWLMGKYDFVLLEDTPYDPDTYQEGVGACPAVTVSIAVSNDFAVTNPEYCEFLSRYSLPSAIISEALAHMQDTGANHEETARWLLKDAHPELVEQWLTEEQAQTLRAAL
jgi:glycine betaine/proline transport system substrate-binding protein